MKQCRSIYSLKDDGTQSNLIRNINSILHKKKPLLSLSENSISFVLATSFIRQELNILYDPSEPRFFLKFLELMTAKSRAKDVFESFEKSQELSTALPQESHQDYEASKAQSFYDLWAVVELAFVVYAAKDSQNQIHAIKSLLNPEILAELNLCILSATSYSFGLDDYDEIFNLHDPRSPFYKNGFYLIAIPGHVCALVIYEDGSFLFYDPNCSQMIRNLEALKDYKKIFSEYSNKSLKKPSTELQCYLIDSKTEFDLKRDPERRQAAVDHMHQSFYAYIQKSFRSKNPFLENWNSGFLIHLYASNNPALKAYRMQVFDDLENLSNTTGYSIGDLLNHSPQHDRSQDFFLSLLFSAHRTHYFEPLEEFFDHFGSGFILSNGLLIAALCLEDRALSRFLIKRLESKAYLNTDILDRLESLVLLPHFDEVSHEVLKKIASDDLRLESCTVHPLLWLVAQPNQRYRELSKRFTKYATFTSASPESKQEFLEYVCASAQTDLFAWTLIHEHFPWTTKELQLLIKKNYIEQLSLVHNAYPNLFQNFDKNTQKDFFVSAFTQKNIGLMGIFCDDPRFDISLETQHMMSLISELKAGKTDLVKFFMEKRLFLRSFFGLARNSGSKDSKIAPLWAKAFCSVSGLISEPDDQDMIGQFFRQALNEANPLWIENFLDLPLVNLKVKNVNKFLHSHTFAYHLLNRHYWKSFEKVWRFLDREDLNSDIRALFMADALPYLCKNSEKQQIYSQDFMQKLCHSMSLNLLDFTRHPNSELYFDLENAYPGLMAQYAKMLSVNHPHLYMDHKQQVFSKFQKIISRLKSSGWSFQAPQLRPKDYKNLKILCAYWKDFLASQSQHGKDYHIVLQLDDFLKHYQDHQAHSFYASDFRKDQRWKQIFSWKPEATDQTEIDDERSLNRSSEGSNRSSEASSWGFSNIFRLRLGSKEDRMIR